MIRESKSLHFGLENAYRIAESVTAKRVGAHQFGKPARFGGPGLVCPGRISIKLTATPASANCHAASLPARPAPTTDDFPGLHASSSRSGNIRPGPRIAAVGLPAQFARQLEASKFLGTSPRRPQRGLRFIDRHRLSRSDVVRGELSLVPAFGAPPLHIRWRRKGLSG